jgi:hypothetical protein
MCSFLSFTAQLLYSEEKFNLILFLSMTSWEMRRWMGKKERRGIVVVSCGSFILLDLGVQTSAIYDQRALQLFHFFFHFLRNVLQLSLLLLIQPTDLQTVWFKSGRFTVPHGSYELVLGGPNSKKLNSSHRWPPKAGPPRDDPRSGPVLFFNELKKIIIYHNFLIIFLTNSNYYF